MPKSSNPYYHFVGLILVVFVFLGGTAPGTVQQFFSIFHFLIPNSEVFIGTFPYRMFVVPFPIFVFSTSQVITSHPIGSLMFFLQSLPYIFVLKLWFCWVWFQSSQKFASLTFPLPSLVCFLLIQHYQGLTELAPFFQVVTVLFCSKYQFGRSGLDFFLQSIWCMLISPHSYFYLPLKFWIALINWCLRSLFSVFLFILFCIWA